MGRIPHETLNSLARHAWMYPLQPGDWLRSGCRSDSRALTYSCSLPNGHPVSHGVPQANTDSGSADPNTNTASGLDGYSCSHTPVSGANARLQNPRRCPEPVHISKHRPS